VTNEVTSDEQAPEEPETDEKYDERSLERLIFFSDAVAAIAITLLAIDLPAPNGSTVSAFWSSFRQHDGAYLAFLVSFVAIASAWTNHHDAFRDIRRADSRLRIFNMVWLLMIIVVPFATKLLIGNGHDDLAVHAFRWGFYALVQVLTAATLFAMVRHMISHRLLAPGTEEKYRGSSDWRSYGPMLGFALSIPVFFVTSYAWLLWIAVPVMAARLLRRKPPSRPRPPG
jgi:uncharacterized membrane protein